MNNNLYQALEGYVAEAAGMLDNTADSAVNFSPQYRRKRKAMISAYKKKRRYIPFNRKLKIALVAAILAIIFTGAAFGVYTVWEKYRVKDYGLYSMLYISEPQGVPRILEEKYEPDWDFSNYEKIVYLDIENQYLMEYQNYSDDIGISFEQSTYEVGEQTFINTENALVMPCEITIDGHEGIYFETYYGEKVIIWCTENYVFSVTGANIGKNELISITESVKKVE